MFFVESSSVFFVVCKSDAVLILIFRVTCFSLRERYLGNPILLLMFCILILLLNVKRLNLLA